MSTQKSAPEVIQDSSNLTAELLRRKIWAPANVYDDWRVFVVVGREGSGKSVTTASILEKVDPTFGPERIHFDPEEFLQQLNDIPADERTGKAMMLDEAGVGMGVRSWYDSEQINLNKLLQTARDDNMIVALTLPRLNELDSQMRGRLHGFCEMRKLKKEEGYAVFSWKDVKPRRDEKDGLLKPYPQLKINNRRRKVTRLRLGPPSDGLMEDYEERKAEFKAELYEETLEDMQDEDEEEMTSKDIAEDIKSRGVDNFLSEHAGNGSLYLDWKLIKAEYEIGRPAAKTVKSLLEADDEVSY